MTAIPFTRPSKKSSILVLSWSTRSKASLFPELSVKKVPMSSKPKLFLELSIQLLMQPQEKSPLLPRCTCTLIFHHPHDCFSFFFSPSFPLSHHTFINRILNQQKQLASYWTLQNAQFIFLNPSLAGLLVLNLLRFMRLSSNVVPCALICRQILWLVRSFETHRHHLASSEFFLCQKMLTIIATH